MINSILFLKCQTLKNAKRSKEQCQKQKQITLIREGINWRGRRRGKGQYQMVPTGTEKKDMTRITSSRKKKKHCVPEGWGLLGVIASR
jgi:hypothetical protein